MKREKKTSIWFLILKTNLWLDLTRQRKSLRSIKNQFSKYRNKEKRMKKKKKIISLFVKRVTVTDCLMSDKEVWRKSSKYTALKMDSFGVHAERCLLECTLFRKKSDEQSDSLFQVHTESPKNVDIIWEINPVSCDCKICSLHICRVVKYKRITESRPKD